MRWGVGANIVWNTKLSHALCHDRSEEASERCNLGFRGGQMGESTNLKMVFVQFCLSSGTILQILGRGEEAVWTRPCTGRGKAEACAIVCSWMAPLWDCVLVFHLFQDSFPLGATVCMPPARAHTPPPTIDQMANATHDSTQPPQKLRPSIFMQLIARCLWSRALAVVAPSSQEETLTMHSMRQIPLEELVAAPVEPVGRCLPIWRRRLPSCLHTVQRQLPQHPLLRRRHFHGSFDCQRTLRYWHLYLGLLALHLVLLALPHLSPLTTDAGVQSHAWKATRAHLIHGLQRLDS